MASISIPAQSSSLNNTFLHTPSMSTSAHTRRHSRNPTASLPAFSFNPATTDTDTENQPPNSSNTTKIASRRAPRPAPLPAFSFNPGADMPTGDRSSPTHPVLEEMVMNQQRMSRSARPAPLPAFTFAPGGPTSTTPSPSKSEFDDVAHGRSTTGHKRAGSEFVGGGGVDGPTLLSTSPQKHEAKPSGPPVTSAGRRGHAHRRSQAVSISDIDTSDLIKAHALAKHRTNSSPASGPVTPSEVENNSFFGHGSPQGRQSISMRSPPSSPLRRESAPGARPRVEFADKIDVIPRPLSMISSETDGSCSTVRYSHSLSNSINSIASPSWVPSVMSSPILEQSPLRRPKSADPSSLLMSTTSSPRHTMMEVNLPKRPLSASGSPVVVLSGSPPTKKKHFWFSHSPERSPVGTPSTEKADPLANLSSIGLTPTKDLPRPRISPERSASFKRRKYHTWTSGIFSKKSKYRASKAKARRAPTPPTLQRRASDKVNQIFDADSTVVLRSDSPETKRTQLGINTSFVPVSSRNISDDLASPVLDLDAAFDMCIDDDKSNSEQQNRHATSRMAKLHSSERRGNIDAFGTVHRRTESAPIMPAFTRSGFGFIRHGSNPSLAEEVFDEEEEDIFLAGQKKNPNVLSPIRKELNNRSSSSPAMPSFEFDGVNGLGLSNVADAAAADTVVIVDPEKGVGADDIRSSKSTLEAPILIDADVTKRPASSPMSFAYPSTQSHYASSTDGRTTTSASMISSPDPDHIHFDNVPRLVPNTAQHSPELYLRPSNDDLSSLSDSISSAMPRISSSANTQSSDDQHHEQRSASMFVPGSSKSNQGWKRSSLASLNRLIPGSANGSKLRFETIPDVVVEEKSKKKTNRLSRLVNFWRTKERIE